MPTAAGLKRFRHPQGRLYPWKLGLAERGRGPDRHRHRSTLSSTDYCGASCMRCDVV